MSSEVSNHPQREFSHKNCHLPLVNFPGRCPDKDRRSGHSGTADDNLQVWSSSLIDVPISSVDLNEIPDKLPIKGTEVDTVTVTMDNNLN